MKTLDDLTGPTPIKRKLLERDIQKACVDWMRSRGYWARKFSSMSQRSVPDYLFALRHEYSIDRGGEASYRVDVKLAVEFKAPGKSLTPAQGDELEKMRQAGWAAFWSDDVEQFKEDVIGYERSLGVTL